MEWFYGPIGLDPNCPTWAFLGLCFGIGLIGFSIGESCCR